MDKCFSFLNTFISPVTGRILCPPDYILVGNDLGIAAPSSLLMDIQLELIELKQKLEILREVSFITGFENPLLEYAQVLDTLNDGFLYNNQGIVSTLPTPEKLPLCYAATTEDLGLLTTYDNGENGIGATLTGFSPLGFTVDDEDPPENSIILVKDQSHPYENGLYVLTNSGSPVSSWVLTRLDIYDQAGEIQPGDVVSVAYGKINAQTFWVETKTVSHIGTDDISFLLFSPLSVLPKDNIWIGNEDKRPIPQPTIARKNLPSLTNKKIWRGDSDNRPFESDALTEAEGHITEAFTNISNLLSTVSSIQSIVNGLQQGLQTVGGWTAIIFLQSQVLALDLAVAIHSSQISDLQDAITTINSQITTINTRIDNLRLNTIPADGDVSFYDFKLINLADPTDPTDGVNLRTLENTIDATEITLEGDVIGTGTIGEPIETELVLTLDQIKLAQNTVDLNNQKISKLKADEVEQKNALNAKFIWDLMHDNVGVVWV